MSNTTGDSSSMSEETPRKRAARASAKSASGTSTTGKRPAKKAGSIVKAAAEKVAPKAPRKRPARKSAEVPEAQSEIRQQAVQAAQFALEKKAVNVRLLDLTQITSMTDYFVICHGESDPQVKAIAENVITRMRDDKGVAPWRSEGWDALQWVLIDFVDFVVHVFQTESRQYYNLERLWADAPAIPVEDAGASPVAKSRSKRTKPLKSGEPEAEVRSAEESGQSHEENTGGVRVISDFNPIPKKSRRRISSDNQEDL